jgi:hypothetical protein
VDASWKVVARVPSFPVCSSNNRWLAVFHFPHSCLRRAGKLWRRPSPQSPAKLSTGPSQILLWFSGGFSLRIIIRLGNRKLFAFRCILNASVMMNGVTQTQTQRPKLPAGPAPVNAPPVPPPAQKQTPGHPHPGNPPTRPTQHTNAQPPSNRGQPLPNAQHTKNKKKTEPAPVDPAVMYESLKNRIAALEEEETHEEEEERKLGTFFTTSTLFDV